MKFKDVMTALFAKLPSLETKRGQLLCNDFIDYLNMNYPKKSYSEITLTSNLSKVSIPEGMRRIDKIFVDGREFYPKARIEDILTEATIEANYCCVLNREIYFREELITNTKIVLTGEVSRRFLENDDLENDVELTEIEKEIGILYILQEYYLSENIINNYEIYAKRFAEKSFSLLMPTQIARMRS